MIPVCSVPEFSETTLMPKPTAETLRTLCLFVFLVALATISRFLDIAPNFAAVAGVALFAGFVFRSRLLAVLVPVAAMLISDTVLGGYQPLVMVSVYLCLMIPVLFKSILGDRPDAIRIVGSALACSVLFFLVTNFAAWGAGGLGYALTLGGLFECYAAALPFFRYTLAGDLAFAALLFGAHALMTRTAARPALAAVAAA